MALIDLSVYRQQPRSLLREGLDGYDRAMQSTDLMRQRQDANAKRKREAEEAQQNAGFERTLRGLVQINDPQTPEGRQGLVRDLSRLGYGKQALGLLGNFQDLERQPSTPAKFDTEYDETGAAYTRDASGRINYLTRPDGSPIRKYEAPKAPTAGKFQLVKNRKGQMVSVDVETGLGRDGKPVDAWQDPVTPKETKPPEPPKPLSGDAAKLVGIAYTLPQDVEGMKAAFTKDYKSSLAGLKSGTNPSLVRLKSQIADKLGRLRSGGAVNVDEEARFDALIAKVNDLAFTDVNDAIATLDDIAYEAQIIMEGVDRDGSFRKQLKDKGLERKPSARVTGPTAGPKAGQVEDGYRFKGGNPADPNSWEKVK